MGLPDGRTPHVALVRGRWGIGQPRGSVRVRGVVRRIRHLGMGDGEGSHPRVVREGEVGAGSGRRKSRRHDGRSSRVGEGFFSCSGRRALGCSHHGQEVRGGHSSHQLVGLHSRDGQVESATCSGHVEGACEGSRIEAVAL